MVQDNVKARRVGDSVVVTVTKPILESTGIAEGDSLLLEALAQGRILVTKEAHGVPIREKLELELEVLRSRKDAIQAEMALGIHEHNKAMPTAHPGIEADATMEGYTLEWTWHLRKLDVEIAQKRLELFELKGAAEVIPDDLTRDHVLQAIDRIAREGVPVRRRARGYCLVHNNRHFPPKYVISVATSLLTGEELLFSDFYGGQQTNSRLERLGFTVVPCACGGSGTGSGGTRGA